MLDYLLSLLAIVLSAALFGGMLFFAGVMAPLVHAKLPKPTAGEFLREVFPIYYLAGMVTAFIGTAVAARPNPIAAVALGLVGLAFLYALLLLLPRINRAQESPEPEDQARFRRLHRQSVLITIVQIAVVLGTLLFLAITGPLAMLLSR
jgi:hypothetical protein